MERQKPHLMTKKIFTLAFFALLMCFQNVTGSEYPEQKILGFIDLDPCQYEDVAKVANLRVFDKDLEEAITASSDYQNPKNSFEQTIQNQNQEYISSLGLL